MPLRFIEHLIVSGFNGLRERQARSKRVRAAQPGPLSSGSVVLGHSLLTAETSGARASAKASSSGEEIVLSPDDRRRHLYVLGATGTGKTTLLLKLIAADLRAGKSLCILDLRGDLIDRVLPLLAPLPDAARRLYLLDLREDGWCLPFNPLAAEDGRHDINFHERAYLVLDAIQAQASGWGVQLEETLRNTLLAIAASGGTLLDIERLLSDDALRARLVGACPDEGIKAFFARYESLSKERRLTWAMPVLNKVTPYLALPPLRRLFGHGEALPLRRIFDREAGTVLLVSLAGDRLHGASHLVGALLLACLENAVMSRAALPEQARVPLSLLVDEFENFASGRFASLIAEGRRFGLSLTLSHQNLSQVEPGLRSALRNNVHTLLLFQTGAQDAAELAGEVGDLEEKGTPAPPHWQQVPGQAESKRDEVRRVLLSQKTGQALLVRRGEAARRVQIRPEVMPNVSSQELKALREAALALYATPAHSVKSKAVNTKTVNTQAVSPQPRIARTGSVGNGQAAESSDTQSSAQNPASVDSPAAPAASVEPDLEPDLEPGPVYRIESRKAPGRFRPKSSAPAQSAPDPETGEEVD